MRIGFDVSQTGVDKAGCGYFADSLIQSLCQKAPQHEYLLYASFGPYYWDAHAPDAAIQRRCRAANVHIRHTSYETAEFFWRNLPPDDLISALGRPDIVHANNFFVPNSLGDARLVYTLYDLSFLHHPEWHTNVNWATTFLGGVFYAALFADGIVAISEYSKRDFLQIFPHFPEERVWVVSLASRFPLKTVSPRPPKRAKLYPGRFWLAVGTLEPRKNYPTLLKAYAKLCQTYPDTAPLAIAGGQGWRIEYLQELIISLEIEDKVHLLGYVDDSELQWLYDNCFAFVYPSFFEGFGLPVLEAMAMGAAVITSNTTSLPEVGGDAVLYFTPHKVDELYEAMKTLHADGSLHKRLQERARIQASRFSWEKTAQQVLKIYENVLALPKQSATIRDK